jgi:uncharacterized protein
MDSKSKKLFINGMTCVSCESIITDELNNITEVHSVTVCRKNKTADIVYSGDEKPDFDKMLQSVNSLGYKAAFHPHDEEPKEKASFGQWIGAIAIVGLFYVVYKYLEWIGLLNWIDVDSTDIGFGVAFMIGIVASLSTCLAVVGAVVISFAAKYKSNGNFYQSSVKPHLLFHLGRLITFFVLGGILGVVGSWFGLSTSFMGWFTIVIAIVLIWMGLNLLGFLPNLSTVGLRLPKKTTVLWNRLKQSEHPLAPIILGGFTFFLPCGFTQSMQLFAVSSGSFWTGGFTMMLFALGTVPILISLGIATTRFQHKKTIVWHKVIGMIIIIFAVYTFMTGYALAGINFNSNKVDVNIGQSSSGQVQEIVMDIDYSGFTPSTLRVKKGQSVRWVINGNRVSGCMNEIIVPALDLRKRIQSGKNIIEFTPASAGTIPFSCWMGMVRGKIIVE